MKPAGSLPAQESPGEFRVLALPPAWRGVAAALKVCSRGFLLVLLAAVLWSENPPTNTFKQMRLFAVFFAAPEALLWCLRTAFAAKAEVAAGVLRLSRRDVTIEVPLHAVTGIEVWRLPLPGPGLDLRLRSGRRFSSGLQVSEASSLVEAMVAGGADASIRPDPRAWPGVFAEARRANPPGRLEHPLLKFVVYSLVPTLPVYRLHQFITYGGTFGEYYTFGLKAWLLGLGLWWISFAFGLLMFAAATRAAVELLCLAAAATAPGRAVGIRRGLERLQRLLYYVGMPAWLVLRLTA
jgi:apolipoprotein N-acyltransferase